jgi:hypothetical protein
MGAAQHRGRSGGGGWGCVKIITKQTAKDCAILFLLISRQTCHRADRKANPVVRGHTNCPNCSRWSSHNNATEEQCTWWQTKDFRKWEINCSIPAEPVSHKHGDHKDAATILSNCSREEDISLSKSCGCSKDREKLVELKTNNESKVGAQNTNKFQWTTTG